MTDISQAGTAGITDNPITRASEDLLQRGDVAAALAENLRYVEGWKGHVVGISGPWGSGETSLVSLVRERLAVAPVLPVLDFDPRMFSGAEQFVDSFFAELAAQLRLKGGRFERIAERLDTCGELLTPLGLVPFLGAWTERLRSSMASPESLTGRLTCEDAWSG